MVVDMRERALSYAKRGWAVIPLWGVRPMGYETDNLWVCRCPQASYCRNPGKHPHGDLVPMGLKLATTEEGVIGRWWEAAPEANIGIVCGPSGLLVIDVDGPEGVKSWMSLEQVRGNTPETYHVSTHVSTEGESSYHVYFTLPGGVEIPRPGAGRLGPHLDHRVGASYVVAAGSRHVSGRRYEEMGNWPVAEAPAWLLEAVKGSERVSAGEGDDGVSLVVHEGWRDQWLTSMAGTLRRRGASGEALLGCLRVLNACHCRPPLEAGEVARIARSVARYLPEEERVRGELEELVGDD